MYDEKLIKGFLGIGWFRRGKFINRDQLVIVQDKEWKDMMKFLGKGRKVRFRGLLMLF